MWRFPKSRNRDRNEARLLMGSGLVRNLAANISVSFYSEQNLRLLLDRREGCVRFRQQVTIPPDGHPLGSSGAFAFFIIASLKGLALRVLRTFGA